MRSSGITSEEKVLKVRLDKRALLVTLRARTSREMYDSTSSMMDLFLAILFVEKEVHPNSRLQPCGPMESVSGTDAEVNGSTSSMSCFNEFET